MTETDRTRNHLITPAGTIAERVRTESTANATIDEVSESGRVEDYTHNDFPDMEIVGDNGPHVSDWDGGEFLAAHCRVLAADPLELDVMTDKFPSWPDEIVQACSRAEYITYCLMRLRKFKDILPQDYLDSTTVTVLDAVVGKRMEEELAALNLKIDTWRAAHPEAQTVRLSDRLEDADA